jgi:hypothetical protein
VTVQRCDYNGNLTDNGTYARYTVNSTYSTVNSKNTRTVTAAYSSDNGATYSAETTLQSATDTANAKTGIYGNNSLAATTSYIVRFTIKDAYGATSTITAPLQSAARPMNIKSNGKGAAFGKMAETDNLLDVSWNERVRGNLSVDGTCAITGNTTVGGTLTTTGTINGITVSHDTYVLGGAKSSVTDENWVSDSKSFIGTYTLNDTWYNTISVRHRNGQGDGNNYGMQLRSKLTTNDNLSWRQHKGGTWGSWKTILDTENTKDYITETGGSGAWWWRKWNNGDMEVFGTLSQTPTSLNNGTNSITATLPVSFVDTSFVVNITPAKCGLLVSAFGDCNSSNDKTHTVNSFILSYKYNYSTAYTVNFNVTVVGKWK